MARYAPDPAQRVTVFLGEAGCGKSELAVQWALTAAERRRDVHFFDLDQTKPLLRSRDAAALLEDAGVTVHFEQQCADAPTQVGGLVPLLLDKSKSVILDVGGNDTGAHGVYHHALGNFVVAGGNELVSAFHLYNTDAAGADFVQILEVAEGGNPYPCKICGLDNGGAGRGFHFHAIDFQFHSIHLAEPP